MLYRARSTSLRLQKQVPADEAVGRSAPAGSRSHNIERCRTWSREHTKKDREAVFSDYGNTCACCGEAESAFLTIDHVNGGGNAHRKTLDAPNMYTWLVRKDYPEGYRVLCFNCNCVELRMEVCPHNG